MTSRVRLPSVVRVASTVWSNRAGPCPRYHDSSVSLVVTCNRWWLARLDPAGAVDVGSFEAGVEGSARPQVALHPAVPPGEAARVDDGRPEVVDGGVVALLDAHNTRAIRGGKAADDVLVATDVVTDVVAHALLLQPRASPAVSGPADPADRP
jgi:hypothetical protein